MKRSTCTHAFVEFVPEEPGEGVVYVSIPYATAVHKCFCGCGKEVVTPLSPTDWQLTFDGKTVSLHPSIGSWNLKCKSHYWVRRDTVVWAPRWSRKEIETERARDQLAKREYFEGGATPKEVGNAEERKSRERLWKRVKKWWSR